MSSDADLPARSPAQGAQPQARGKTTAQASSKDGAPGGVLRVREQADRERSPTPPPQQQPHIPSSRICVKNLPKKVQEEKIRSHFSAKGTITEVFLPKTADGVFRRMAFVGFQTPQEAAEAVAFFNGTYFGSSKVIVEEAIRPGDARLGRPWGKNSEGSSAYERKFGAARSQQNPSSAQGPDQPTARSLTGRKRDATSVDAGVAGDPDKEKMLNEFLGIATKRPKFWANDDTTMSSASAPLVYQRQGNHATKDADADADGDSSSDDEYEDMPQAQQQGNARIDEDDSNGDPQTAGEGLAEGQSNLDFFKSKRVADFSDDSDGESSAESDSEESRAAETDADAALPLKQSAEEMHRGKRAHGSQERPGDQEVDDVPAADTKLPADVDGERDPRRVFVRGLPYSVTESELDAFFSQYGSVEDVHLPLASSFSNMPSGSSTADRGKRAKGFAMILFETADSAARAIAACDGQIVFGRFINAVHAYKVPAETEEAKKSLSKKGTSSYKAQKAAQQQQDAANAQNWNSTFMNQNTVVSAAASKLGMEKIDFLNPTSENMAVRVAIAETTLLAEAEVLLKDLSKESILVKNLPPQTSVRELEELFGKYGELAKCQVAPSGSMAVVEFVERNHAKRAFKGLAYRHFKDVPLYLEFGKAAAAEPVAKQAEKLAGAEAQQEKEDAGSPTRTLFVKNLAFETSEDAVRRLFRGAKTVKLKRGFGFVEYASAEEARAGRQAADGLVVDGHKLSVAFSRVSDEEKGGQQQAADGVAATAGVGSKTNKLSKLIIRNIAFEATRKDIKELCSAFASVKSVRLPKRFDGRHRGFAFVDFATPQEAAAAFGKLRNSHLYGRHLVIEWGTNEAV